MTSTPTSSSVYLALRDHSDKPFIRHITSHTGNKVVFDCVESEIVDPAFRYLYRNRTCWGGKVCRPFFSNPQGLKSLTSERLQAVAAHLQGTQITCGDYSSLMLAGDRRTLIYCDAPYHIRRSNHAERQAVFLPIWGRGSRQVCWGMQQLPVSGAGVL